MLPSQQTLLLPLLETLNDAGGKMSPQEVYEELARRVSLSEEERRRRVSNGREGRAINEWERRVRNTRQQAAARGLVETDPAQARFNLWALTEKAKRGLLNCKPGVRITIFTTELGESIWAECETAVGLFSDHSIDLLLTSPPYPLQRTKKYGNRPALAHTEWLLECLSMWKSKLTATGSLVLNLADVWEPGTPTISLYQERLLLRLCDDFGFHLNQRLYWHSPAKMPSPAEWVTVRRVRVTPSVENLWWLSTTPFPKANNRNALRPYSESMKKRLEAGGERRASVRPSGHKLKEGAFTTDCGGSIPHSLIVASNTASNDQYQRMCRDAGLPIHPARFPEQVPEYCIKLMTDEGDLVVDIFSGSTMTGRVAERLGRRWACIEKSLAYAAGGLFRFTSSELQYVNEIILAGKNAEGLDTGAASG